MTMPIESQKPQSQKAMPETVRLFMYVAAVMIGGELIHQIISTVIVLLDPAALIEQAKDAQPSAVAEMGDAQLEAVAYASIALAELFALAVILVLALAVRAVAKKASWAGNALKLLMVFGGYFALRMLVVMAVPAGGGAVPTAVIAVDGAIQIIAGVAGICAIVLGTQDELRQWVAKHGAKDAPGQHNESGS